MSNWKRMYQRLILAPPDPPTLNSQTREFFVEARTNLLIEEGYDEVDLALWEAELLK